MHPSQEVLYFSTVREIWKDLEERYDQSSGPQLFTLQQSLAELYQTSSMSVAEFFTKMKALWDQINGNNPIPVCSRNKCSCNLTQKFLKAQEDERIVYFLMKLNPKFANVRTNILMMQPLPNIALAYRLIIHEEKQQSITEISSQNDQPMAFAGNFNRRPEFKKTYIQQNTSQSHNNLENVPRSYQGGITQRKLNGFMNGAMQCTYCHKRGHNKEN